MNKRNIFLIASLFILFLIVPSAYAFSFSDFWNNLFGKDITGMTTVTCIDTDGGRNPQTYGELTLSDGTVKKDVCYTTTIVAEEYCCSDIAPNTGDYFCDSINPPAYGGLYMGCGELGKTCVNGACSGDMPPCSDSDGGVNYNVKGTATGISSSSGGEASRTDYCLSGGSFPPGSVFVMETYCNINNYLDEHYYDCAKIGKECIDGACVSVSSSTNTSTSSSSTTTSTTSSNVTCSDSDGGKTYGTKGIVTLSNGTSASDSCSGQVYLFETYCLSNNLMYDSYTCYDSSAGRGNMRCIDGACINPNATTTTTSTSPTSPTTSTSTSSSSSGGGGGTSSTLSATPAVPATSATPATSTSSAIPSIPAIPAIPSTKQENITELVCKDSDEGINPNLFGKTCQNDNCVIDICISKDYLIESYCVGNLASIFIQECEFGCKNGICLQENTIVFNPDSYSGPIKVPEELIDEEISEIEFICNGCFQDKKCYPFGYRKSKQYCSEDSTFIEQFSEEEACENNFQCRSNVCVSEECVSSSLIKKIFSFFVSMFS